MKSFGVMTLFREQLERALSTQDFSVKVITTPSPVDEKGMIVKVSLLKTYLRKPSGERVVRLRVSVCGMAESDQGIKDALTAIERLDNYLAEPVNLEDATPDHTKIPDTRVLTQVSEEDSFFDSPDALQVQEVQDDRIVTITVPNR